jgi:EAL domain-containing protein (putative c-di-GMP-specific phosphodiesterase class I)
MLAIPSTGGLAVNLLTRGGWHNFIRGLSSEEATADTQSMRGLLRHHLTHATEGIVLAALVASAVLGLGSRPLFLTLAAYTGAWVLIDIVGARSDSRMSPQLGFQLAILTWPAAFVMLGAAGWSGAAYHGEVVALIGLLVAGMVALVQSLRTTVLWTIAATAGLVIGASFGRPLGQEQVLAAGGILAGAAFGNRMHQVIEDFLGRRKQLLHEVTRVPSSPDPFVMAAALLEPLARHTPLKIATITWFTADGRSILLGIVGKNAPAFLRPGSTFPEHRNEYFRRQAASGPWITGWTVRDDDAGYSRGVAAMGVDAVVYMPLSYAGRMIGMLGAAVANPAGGQSTAAEHLPVLAEMGDVIATALGPTIAVLEERSSAAHLIDEILMQRRYWPVFQPIRDLTTNRIVGFEALTRFDAPQTTQRLFDHAALMGRGKDLEIATMTAAVKAAARLPGHAWVSVNASAAVLSETDTIASILEPLQRPTVIELSEHEMISDYHPIASAMKLLGPNRSLAVDDAGSGFASLRHILEARPAYVKMDIGLVQGASVDPTRRALVAGFVHFARDADFTLVAEGIEDAEDQATLKKLGVALGQGYVLGRPDRAESFVGQAAPAKSRSRRAQPVRPS